jgi:peptide-methionine (S)-S-oxide reductase
MPIPYLKLILGLLFLPGATPARHSATAVFAGGCYWGTEYVFEHLKGVEGVVSGFARDPATGTPDGLPQPVEAVHITYNSDLISYQQLLEVFFLVAHDPTTLDRQGPDVGAEYRAVVLTRSPTEAMTALQYIGSLRESKKFSAPIVTQIKRLAGFTPAPPAHQDYSIRHLTDAYVVQNDIPKLERLKREFPALYQETRVP